MWNEWATEKLSWSAEVFCTVDLIMGLLMVVTCMQHPASLQHNLKVTPSWNSSLSQIGIRGNIMGIWEVFPEILTFFLSHWSWQDSTTDNVKNCVCHPWRWKLPPNIPWCDPHLYHLLSDVKQPGLFHAIQIIKRQKSVFSSKWKAMISSH